MTALVVAATASGPLLIELGVVLLVLAVLGRVAARIGISSIPLYLVAGLLLGNGSAVPLDASSEFIRVAADLGVVLLLLLLGLEYQPDELRDGLVSNWPAGLFDAVVNFAPGYLAGLLLGWGQPACVVLGGVCWVSSSGIIAKVLGELDRFGNRETPVVLAVLVIEDIAMAAFLPIVGVLLVGTTPIAGFVSVTVAVAAVTVALVVSVRWSARLSRALDVGSPELLLLTVLGLTFLVGGLAEELQVSAAIGAFLLGVSLSGQIAHRGRELLSPVRDVFGGLFFVFFGLQIDPATLPPALGPAVVLGVVTAATKYLTGWWAARRAGIGRLGRRRAGVTLIARGEFSIVLGGVAIAAGVEPRLGPLVACYVLLMAIAGPLAVRAAGPRDRR